jgi:hypothetical protein
MTLRNRDGCFVSYDEPHADRNFNQATEMMGLKLKRIHGVRGMRRAYELAAGTADTEEFFLIDADLFFTKPFDVYAVPSLDDETSMVVWKTTNPLTGAEYGYGGLKLMRKSAFDPAANSIDVTAGIEGTPQFMDVVVGESRFNSSPFHAWKAGLREAFKLSQSCEYCSRPHDRDLLLPWLTVGDSPGRFADQAQLGVDAGLELRTLVDAGRIDARVIQDGQRLREFHAGYPANGGKNWFA